MAGRDRSPRDIEREIEKERAELRGTIDAIMNRMTFDDAWMRAGEHLRDNWSTYGRTLGHLAREKPIAVGLTLAGIAWLMFGPSTPVGPDRRRGSASAEDRYRRGSAARTDRVGPGLAAEPTPSPTPATDRAMPAAAAAPREPSTAGAPGAVPGRSTSVSEAPASPRTARSGGMGAAEAGPRQPTSVSDAPASPSTAASGTPHSGGPREESAATAASTTPSPDAKGDRLPPQRGPSS